MYMSCCCFFASRIAIILFFLYLYMYFYRLAVNENKSCSNGCPLDGICHLFANEGSRVNQVHRHTQT